MKKENKTYQTDPITDQMDTSFYSFTRDMSKCVKCYKCVDICNDLQGISVFKLNKDGSVGIKGKNMADTQCISCGQCIRVCPGGALHEKNNLDFLENHLKNPKKHVIAQLSPALKHSIGEEFNIYSGKDISPNLIAALKEIGFSKVFSTDFSSDINIIETTAQLRKELAKKNPSPIFTSACTGWINYAEKFYPEFLGNLATCKSPQQILGALSKSYYKDMDNIREEDIVSVAMMPCIAKKDDANRFDMEDEKGYRDVDLVLTIKEVASLLKSKGIDLKTYEKEANFDKPMGSGTGASRIKAVSGGLSEGMLRVLSTMTGDKSIPMEFEELRGMKGIKISSIMFEGKKVNIAVINGIKNVPVILDAIKDAMMDFHLIEVTACPGGCINGGGTPTFDDPAILKNRIDEIYSFDLLSKERCSLENPDVKTLYSEYLGEPLGEESQKLFYFHYKNRKKRKTF
jgi:iron-only hydrogenase group A